MPQQLVKLEPIAVENFITALKRKTGKLWSTAACAFDGYIHTAMHDYAGGEASRIIAYDTDKLIIQDDSNENPMTILEYQEFKVQELMDNDDALTHEKAKIRAFPKVNKRVTQNESLNYLQAVQQVIIFAEMNMTNEINILLNNDGKYRQTKQDRCLIGWLKILRNKAINASNSAELAKRNIEKQIETLRMDNTTDGYYTLREKFKSLVNALKTLPNYQLDEKHLINILVVKLDRYRFPNIFFEFTAGRYQDVNSLKETYKILNEIQEKAVVVGNQYSQLYSNRQNSREFEKKKGQTNNQTQNQSDAVVNFNNANNSNNSNNSNNTNDTERSNKMCRFYKPGVENSCFHSSCKFVHVSDNNLFRELNELESKRKALIEKANKAS